METYYGHILGCLGSVKEYLHRGKIEDAKKEINNLYSEVEEYFAETKENEGKPNPRRITKNLANKLKASVERVGERF